MAVPSYTPLPTAPSLGSADFDTKADAFLGALPGFGTYINSVITYFTTEFYAELDDGTLGAPALRFISDVNTGFYRPANNTIACVTDGAAAWTANTTGLGIGTTPEAPLHVERANAITSIFDRTGTDGAVIQIRNDDVQVGTISVSGSTTSYNTTSDRRLKNNIKDAGDAGVVIDALQVRQFDWLRSGEHSAFGFVAQEIHEVFPEAATPGEGEDDPWAVDPSKLVPMLVKEIQALRARVAALEAKQ